jgi:hypothetical protein
MALPALPAIAAILRGTLTAGRALGAGLGRGLGGLLARGGGIAAGQQIGEGISGIRGLGLGRQLATQQLVKFDMNALARRLATPVPSRQQVDAEHRRIEQVNQANSPFALMAKQTLGVSKNLAALGAAAVAGQRGLTGLASMINQRALADLKSFNPDIARTATRRDRFNFEMSVGRGRAVAGSTGSLDEALQRMQKSYQPYTLAAENLMNGALEIVANFGTAMGDVLEAAGVTEAARRFNSAGNEKPEVDLLQHVIRRRLGMPTVKTPLSPRPDPHQKRVNDTNDMWLNSI